MFGLEIGCTAGTIITFILMTGVITCNVKRACQITLFSTVFTRMAFLNIGGNSILVHQILTLVLLVKICFSDFDILKRRCRVPVSLLLFVVYAGISIFFALFNSDVEVINVDNVYTTLRFGLQQFTQYAYLVFAVFFMILIYDLLEAGKILLQDIFHVADICYIAVIVLGFLQLFVPMELFDAIFRNSLIGTVHQTINGRYRVDSVFGEASMMMLFVTPVFCQYLYRLLFGKVNPKNIFFVLLGLAAFWGNLSSSFLVGMGVMVFVILISVIVKGVKGELVITKKNVCIMGVCLCVLIFLGFLFRGELEQVWNILQAKLQGENVSGRERRFALRVHLDVFLNHMICGVGFGTLRGYDLITNWLAQMGIIGVGLYLHMMITSSYRLAKTKMEWSKEILVMLLVHNAIMLVAVPEFCFIFLWVYYAAGWFLISLQRKEIVAVKH